MSDMVVKEDSTFKSGLLNALLYIIIIPFVSVLNGLMVARTLELRFGVPNDFYTFIMCSIIMFIIYYSTCRFIEKHFEQ